MRKLLLLILLLVSPLVSAHEIHRDTRYYHRRGPGIIVVTTGQYCSTQPGQVVIINGVRMACICDVNGYCSEQPV